MKKFLLSLCMVLALTACDNKKEEAQADSKPVIKIGASLPLSGDMAETGKNLQAALSLALKDEQAKENLKYDYQLVFEVSVIGTYLNLSKILMLFLLYGEQWDALLPILPIRTKLSI